MELCTNAYFHLYNRSNNNEVVFKSPENYLFFLSNYRSYFGQWFDTIAYCLMPTHFHFLVYIKPVVPNDELEQERRIEEIKKDLGILLSSYTKAINKRYSRHDDTAGTEASFSYTRKLVQWMIIPTSLHLFRTFIRTRYVLD